MAAAGVRSFIHEDSVHQTVLYRHLLVYLFENMVLCVC